MEKTPKEKQAVVKTKSIPARKARNPEKIIFSLITGMIYLTK